MAGGSRIPTRQSNVGIFIGRGTGNVAPCGTWRRKRALKAVPVGSRQWQQ